MPLKEVTGEGQVRVAVSLLAAQAMQALYTYLEQNKTSNEIMEAVSAARDSAWFLHNMIGEGVFGKETPAEAETRMASEPLNMAQLKGLAEPLTGGGDHDP